MDCKVFFSEKSVTNFCNIMNKLNYHIFNRHASNRICHHTT